MPTTFNDITNITENNPQGNTQNPSSSAIPATSLGSNQQFTIPTGSNALQQLLQQLLGSAQNTSAGIETTLSNQQTQQQADTTSAFNNYITSLSGGSLSDQYTKLAESSGLNANTKQLGELNQQITNRSNALTKALQTAEDTNAFAGFAQGEQGRINKAAAIELGALSANAQALQGNITLAKDTIKQALEFANADKTREIEARKVFYEANKDKLSETTKSLLTVQLKKDERANKAIEDLNEFKEKAWETASKNGAPASVLSGILNADSRDTASKAGSGFLQSEADRLDLKLKRLQLSKLSSELDDAAALKGVSSKDLPLIVKSASDKILKIQGLIDNNKGLTASSGTAKRRAGFSSAIRDWRADVKNVLSDLTVDELGRVKASGVTFGSLTEGERKAVGDAATALNSAAFMDEQGRLTGYFDMSEDKVRQELKTIQDYTKIDFKRRTGMDYDTYVSSQNTPVTEENYADQLLQLPISSPFSIFG